MTVPTGPVAGLRAADLLKRAIKHVPRRPHWYVDPRRMIQTEP